MHYCWMIRNRGLSKEYECTDILLKQWPTYPTYIKFYIICKVAKFKLQLLIHKLQNKKLIYSKGLLLSITHFTSQSMHIDKPASAQSEDSFQRYEFAKRIAAIVATPKIDKSLIVGLYGRWGEGKTTVMNFIQRELPPETVVVNFNPWLFSDQQHLLKSFFSSISEALGVADKTSKEKIGELLSNYGGAIGTLTQFIGVKTDNLEKLGNKLKSTSTEQLKKRIDELIIESQSNIVVFVDDIDRLDIEEIQYVFKLVKLVGDFPRTAYILSFDDEMVSAALSPKYGGDNNSAGYNFLEKIIQVPLKIPKASRKALYKYTTDLLKKVLDDFSVELNEEETDAFADAFNIAFLPFMDNPRLAVRYSNSFSFGLPLLKGEVNVGDLLIIEGIKIFYPELYDFIRQNSYLFLNRKGNSEREHDEEERKTTQQKISNATKIYFAEKRAAIIEILQVLFPQLKAVYEHSSYSDKAYIRWTEERKICSAKYFDRYFSYSVQEGDIPDNYFTKLLAGLQTNFVEQLSSELKQCTERYSAFDLVQKLRMHEEHLNEVQSENLALALADIGYTFPIEEDFHFATTYGQSAILISALIRNVKPTRQLTLVLDLLSKTPSLEYAMEINYRIMSREKNNPDMSLFSESDEVSIQRHLVSRFQNEMTEENFFNNISDGNLWRILSWWSRWDNQKDALQAFLNRHLKDKRNPDFALKLIKVFTPTMHASSLSPQSKRSLYSVYKAGFYESNFEAIKEVVNVHLLNDNLLPHYGMKPHGAGPSTISDRDPIDDETIVSVFQWFLEKD